MPVTLSHYLLLAGILFAISILGKKYHTYFDGNRINAARSQY